jgi:hypothetical protein
MLIARSEMSGLFELAFITTGCFLITTPVYLFFKTGRSWKNLSGRIISGLLFMGSVFIGWGVLTYYVCGLFGCPAEWFNRKTLQQFAILNR